jgi:platelet-activating factor acetylhydrolase IB subunit alpha
LELFKSFKTLQGHEHEVSSVEFLPSGDFLVSSSYDSTIKLWDTSTGFCVHTVTGHTNWVMSVCVNTNGTLIASGSRDESVIIWSVDRIRQKAREVIVMNMSEHENVVDCVKFANNEASKTI